MKATERTLLLTLLLSCVLLSLSTYSVHAPTFYTLIIVNSDTSMGTISPLPGSYYYENATSLTLTAYPKSGYVFTGWKREVPDIQPVVTLTNPLIISPSFTGEMELQLTITVYWSPANVNLTVTSFGQGTTDLDGVTPYAALSPVTITATPNEGYVLDYWLSDGITIVGWAAPVTLNFLITNHMDVEAHFTVDPAVYSFPVFGSIPNMIGSVMLMGVLGFCGFKMGEGIDKPLIGFGLGFLMGIVYSTTVGYFPVWILLLISIALAIIIYMKWLK